MNEVRTYAVNDAKWKAAREYCKDRQMVFMILTEKELQVRSTFTDIKAKQTGGRTKQWWRNKLRTALNTYVSPQVGREMVFFDYPNPKFKEKMFHWDRFHWFIL